MARYKMRSRPNGLRIRVTDAAGNEQHLLDALQECKEGRCSCPTPEYEKLASMHVTSAHGTVQIDLQTKPGSELETEAVRRCLDFTVDRLSAPDAKS